MDAQNIRAFSEEKLLDEIEDKRIDLFNLRFQQASGQLEDLNAIRYAKRDLARLLTVQRERQLAAQILAEENDNGE